MSRRIFGNKVTGGIDGTVSSEKETQGFLMKFHKKNYCSQELSLRRQPNYKKRDGIFDCEKVLCKEKKGRP